MTTEDWMDPWSVDDPAAREREQRRREREARRRQRLGQRVGETRAAEPTSPPSPPSPPATMPPSQQPTRPSPVEPTAAEVDSPSDDGKGADGPPPEVGEPFRSATEPRLPPLPPSDQPLPRRTRGSTVRRRRIAVAAIVVVIGLILVFLGLLFQPFHGPGHGRVNVRIPKGASASQIADLLDGKGVVANSTLFRIRLDLSGKSGEIQAGRYPLALGMSYGDAIDALTNKVKPVKPKTTTVSVPEGYDRLQTAAVLRKDGVKGSYTSASKSYKGFDPAKYGAKHPANLEGFLFPATYKLKPNQTATDLVGQQLAAFQQYIKRVNMSYARSKNLTTYDVLTIASIIQREAGVKDFSKVGAVVYNRLHDDMPLQIDATIRFAENNYTKPLTSSDLQLNSPYNTYTNPGLPPGPISNPGLAAIQAAAHPAHVPYLYYVTKPGACGRLLFATTYAEAQRQQARYNNARAAAGGKSPTSC